MPDFKNALISYAESAGVATDDTTLLKIAMREIDPAADANARSLEVLQGAAVDVKDAVSTLADEIANFGKQNIDAERAAIKFEEQLFKLTEQVASGTDGLDLNTEAGRANSESLLDMAEATSRAAETAHKAGASQEEVNAILLRGREALIDARVAYGDTREAAEKYADQILATPTTVTTRLELEDQEAKRRLASFLGSIPGAVGIALSTHHGLASGGTVGFAGGGTIPGAANGMTIGLGGGVRNGTVYVAGTAKSDSVIVALSKGEEVIQQPFAEANRSLLKAINSGQFHQGMLQPSVVVNSSSSPVSLDGMRVVLEVEGHTMSGIIRSEIDGALVPLSSGAVQSRFGVG